MVDQLDLDAGRRGEIGHRRGRQAADPEERVDLAVLDGVDGLGDAEPLALHVLVLVEAGGLDHAERHHFGGAAGRAGGDALALEVGHLLDAGALDRHHMHPVRIEHHQRPQRHLAALELVLAVERVERGVGHGEAEFALAGADQLEIVDRAAGDFGGRLHVRERSSTARWRGRRRADNRRRRCRRCRSRWSSAGRGPTPASASPPTAATRQHGRGLLRSRHHRILPALRRQAGRGGASVLYCHSSTPRPIIRPGTEVWRCRAR